MVIEPIDWHHETMNEVSCADAPTDVERKWAQAQASQHHSAHPVRSVAEIVGEVWALEAVANDLPPDPHEVGQQAIAAAQHALLWTAGLLSEMELHPSDWAKPIVCADDAAGNLTFTEDQLDGMACMRCHRPAPQAPMVPVPFLGRQMFVCADACLDEVTE